MIPTQWSPLQDITLKQNGADPSSNGRHCRPAAGRIVYFDLHLDFEGTFWKLLYIDNLGILAGLETLGVEVRACLVGQTAGIIRHDEFRHRAKLWVGL